MKSNQAMKMQLQTYIHETIWNMAKEYDKQTSGTNPFIEFGKITTDKGNGLYTVTINEVARDLYALNINNVTYGVNDIVVILICNSSDKFILAKRPN